MIKKREIFHRKNRVCKRFGVMPSKSIMNSLRSIDEELSFFAAKQPLSKRL